MSATEKKDSFSLKAKSCYVDSLIMAAALCVPCVWINGYRVLAVLAVSVGTAFICELFGGILLYNRLTVSDLASVTAGAVIALMLPANIPLYVPAAAASFAVIAARLPFGVAGGSPCPPAAAGLAFVQICFSEKIFLPDSLSAMLHSGRSPGTAVDILAAVFSGKYSSAAATGFAAVLLGCMIFRIIRSPRLAAVMAGFLAAVSAFALVLPRVNSGRALSLLCELCSGAVLFACVFLITDPCVKPKNALYGAVHGLTAGVLCVIFTRFGAYSDGTCFAVILAAVIYPATESIFANKKNKTD